MGQQAPELRQPLEYIVHRCIANRPEDRFATADEVLQNFDRAYQFMMAPPEVSNPVSPSQSSSRHLSGALNRPSNALLDENVPASEHELVALQHSGYIPVVTPSQSQSTFNREDYNAPTTRFDPVKQQGQQPAGSSSKPGKTSSSGKRRSLLPLLSSITIILILAIIGAGYYTYQAVTATTVNINLSPQTHVISQIYTIKADPTIQTAKLDTKSIPARPFNVTEQSSPTGPTTGKVNCIFGISDFGCQQGVSQDDVDSLVSQIQPQLEREITQELEQKVSNISGTAVSPISFQTPSVTPKPAVGEAGKTVTVTVQEQGSIGYIMTSDVQHMAQQLVTQQAQQYGQNYVLLTSSIRIGLPVIEGVDPSGFINIEIPAGCIVQYQFPKSELQAITDGLKGRTLKDANNYLVHQPGVDPKTVVIHFTVGKSDKLPGDSQRINIITIYPTNTPLVQLQSVPTPTFTPTTDQGNNISPTPTDNQG
jgi:hypothetical protein